MSNYNYQIKPKITTSLINKRFSNIVMSKKIIVFCAHSDDQAFGLGGTLPKYAKEGKEISVIVFSFGESTHPWLQRKYSASMRVKESQRAGRLLGAKETTFLGLKEGKFKEEFERKKLKGRIRNIIMEKLPYRIFIHSENDAHPDHKAVYEIIMNLIEEIHYPCEVYSFDIWNPVELGKQNKPMLYVDISDTFNLKIQALNLFKSQRLSLWSLLLGVYFQAFLNGLHNDCRFAERFYKVK